MGYWGLYPDPVLRWETWKKPQHGEGTLTRAGASLAGGPEGYQHLDTPIGCHVYIVPHCSGTR